jgi:alpha-L-arabinofuranosidase
MKAIRTVLTGPDADAVNEDGEPPAVKPESSTETIEPSFAYTALACSLTVFRINR